MFWVLFYCIGEITLLWSCLQRGDGRLRANAGCTYFQAPSKLVCVLQKDTCPSHSSSLPLQIDSRPRAQTPTLVIGAIVSRSCSRSCHFQEHIFLLYSAHLSSRPKTERRDSGKTNQNRRSTGTEKRKRRREVNGRAKNGLQDRRQRSKECACALTKRILHSRAIHPENRVIIPTFIYSLLNQDTTRITTGRWADGKRSVPQIKSLLL